MEVRDKLFIGGEWVEPDGKGTIEVISPHTEEVIGTVPDASPVDIDRAVAAARKAFDEGPWPRMSPAERAEGIKRLSGALQSRAGHRGSHLEPERFAEVVVDHGPGLLGDDGARHLRRHHLGVPVGGPA